MKYLVLLVLLVGCTPPLKSGDRAIQVLCEKDKKMVLFEYVRQFRVEISDNKNGAYDQCTLVEVVIP